MKRNNKLEKQLLELKKKGIEVEVKFGVIPESVELQPEIDVPVFRKPVPILKENIPEPEPTKKRRTKRRGGCCLKD